MRRMLLSCRNGSWIMVHGSWFIVHSRVLHFVVFLSFQISGFFTLTINIPCSIFGVGADGFMVHLAQGVARGASAAARHEPVDDGRGDRRGTETRLRPSQESIVEFDQPFRHGRSIYQITS